MSAFGKNLNRSVGVQNAIDSAKVFLQRSLAILEENKQQHQEALCKVSSLETEVAKWRATVHTIWRQELPKVANAIVVFVETVRSNYQLSSKVGSVLFKLLHTRLDSDELFACCKGLMEKKKNLARKVEDIAVERDELTKVVADLEA